jgi:hypothetical protein
VKKGSGGARNQTRAVFSRCLRRVGSDSTAVIFFFGAVRDRLLVGLGAERPHFSGPYLVSANLRALLQPTSAKLASCAQFWSRLMERNAFRAGANTNRRDFRRVSELDSTCDSCKAASG